MKTTLGTIERIIIIAIGVAVALAMATFLVCGCAKQKAMPPNYYLLSDGKGHFKYGVDCTQPEMSGISSLYFNSSNAAIDAAWERYNDGNNAPKVLGDFNKQ